MTRGFSRKEREYMLEAQDGKCTECYKQIAIRTSEGDHVIPWRSLEKTDVFNGQMLCIQYHKEKTKIQSKIWWWDKPSKDSRGFWF